MLKIMKISDILRMQVYTDAGDYFGEIEEANLSENKISGWRIKLARESALASVLGGAKGLIVPHQFIRAIGDIVIVNKSAVPAKDEELKEGEELTE